MKRIILSMLAVVALVSATQAQDMKDRDSKRPPMMDRRHPGEEFKQLNLTADQQAQFKALNENFKKQLAELRSQDEITVKESRQRMEALRKDHKEKMDAVFTADQKAKLEKMKQDRQDKMKARSDERFQKMQTGLGLTADQVTQLKSNREKLQQQLKALRENKTLAEDAKRQQMQDLMKQQRESFKSVLTPEQLQKMKDMHKDRPEPKKVS